MMPPAEYRWPTAPEPKPCTRHLWGALDGLLCSRTDAHPPGPATCRFVSDDCPDKHDASEARATA